MIVSILCAIVHGSAFPLMIIVFGNMIDLFVNSGMFAAVVVQLDDLGILASIGYTQAQVVEDPDLLQ